ncbi:MAG: hypothetical protein MHM6MM_004654 [Cercozoa sp. M6MM]
MLLVIWIVFLFSHETSMLQALTTLLSISAILVAVFRERTQSNITQAESTMSQTALRSVRQIVQTIEKPEGQKVMVRRAIGNRQLPRIDPFLMLDEFCMKVADLAPGAGFPPHPHRGFETVTYMLEGSNSHRDFKGNHGILNPGDLQWMTAGRGIVHSEMPHAADPETGRLRGLQLWVNLPRNKKMMKPRYQELKSADVPEVVSEDGLSHVRVFAGSSMGTSATVRTVTPITYLQVTLQPGGLFSQNIEQDWNAFLYIVDGEVTVNNRTVGTQRVVEFARDGTKVTVSCDSAAAESARFVLCAGKPLDEPVPAGFLPSLVMLRRR